MNMMVVRIANQITSVPSVIVNGRAANYLKRRSIKGSSPVG